MNKIRNRINSVAGEALEVIALAGEWAATHPFAVCAGAGFVVGLLTPFVLGLFS